MRSISAKRLAWLLRRQHAVIRRAIRVSGFLSRRRGLVAHGSKTVIRIVLPKDILSEKYEQRALLVRAVRLAMDSLQMGRRVRFDFSPAKRIFPGGMLILVAHIELLRFFYPNKVKVSCHPDSTVAKLFHRFGLGESFGINCRTSYPHHHAVNNWNYLTGSNADGEKITELINGLSAEINADIPEGLYDVLAEALTNVRQHAYKSGSVPDILKRWWLFSRYDAPKGDGLGNIFIGIYDIGIGIQNSLRVKLTAKELVFDAGDEILGILKLGDQNLLEKLLLKRAIEGRRSSTGDDYRGYGLPEMREFIMGTDKGRLYIASGSADYACVPPAGRGAAYGNEDFLPGTLILWSLPLRVKEGQP